MSLIKKTELLYLLPIVLIGILFRVFIITEVPIEDYLVEPILLTDLLGQGKSLGRFTILVFGAINILLLITLILSQL